MPCHQIWDGAGSPLEYTRDRNHLFQPDARLFAQQKTVTNRPLVRTGGD